MNHTARRVARLKEFFEVDRYLEIGVHRGETFFDVDVPIKVGVDPEFKFDISAHQGEFHSIYSDQYFASRQGSDEYFDLIFLDGLHTFESTLKDFINSLSVSHSRTVWIIDDTYPVDVFSSLPDQLKTKQFRRAAGGRSKDWHGDVFKLIFFIHDFMQMFSYLTINDYGNPQTIVWRKPQSRIARFNNLEKISRLTYFDFIDNIDVMQLRSEEVAINEFANDYINYFTCDK